jgi:hypothetical protein
MKKSPPWTPTYKISALRQLHPLVGRRRSSRKVYSVYASPHGPWLRLRKEGVDIVIVRAMAAKCAIPDDKQL